MMGSGEQSWWAEVPLRAWSDSMRIGQLPTVTVGLPAQIRPKEKPQIQYDLSRQAAAAIVVKLPLIAFAV